MRDFKRGHRSYHTVNTSEKKNVEKSKNKFYPKTKVANTNLHFVPSHHSTYKITRNPRIGKQECE